MMRDLCQGRRFFLMAALLSVLISAMQFAALAPTPLRGAAPGVGAAPSSIPVGVAFPETPDPVLCTVAPRSVAALQAILATPFAAVRAGTPLATVFAAVIGTPPGPESPASPVPAGRPADAATVAGVTAAVRELVACVNSGDLLRQYALVTDRLFVLVAGVLGPLPPQIVAVLQATPTPSPPAARVAILAIRDVRVLAGGTVRAVVVTQYPGQPPAGGYAYFVKRGPRWLLDDVAGGVIFPCC